MQRSLVAFAVLTFVAVGCDGATVGGGSSPANQAGSSTMFAPAPDAFVPRRPGPLAHALAKTTFALQASIRRWTTNGDTSHGKPPLDLRLQALYQQRIYRFLAQDDALARKTVDALPSWARAEATANLTAGRDIYSLAGPVKHRPKVRIRVPKPAGALRSYYAEAQKRFHVAWTVLAAINYVESKFGRVTSASYAGAQGPMQFIPSTWRAYGMGGNVHDDHDAILGAANYLHASGAPKNYRNAIYNYNHAWAYVDAVLIYAHRMQQDPRGYYEYYDWQVFVHTKNGDTRLTGPGK